MPKQIGIANVVIGNVGDVCCGRFYCVRSGFVS